MGSVHHRGAVLGIDVGFSRKRRTTGFCWLEWDQDRVAWRCAKAGTDEADRARALSRVSGGMANEVAAVAIDGPLRPGLEVKTRYRAAESVLSRGKLGKRGKPAPTNAGSGPALHEAATELARFAMRNLEVGPTRSEVGVGDSAVFEAFPNLFLGVLCEEAGYPQRPLRSRKWTDTLFPLVRDRLAQLIADVLPKREIVGRLDIEDHEEVAALVCALTALCAVQREFVAVGSQEDGFIILPPLYLWGASASEGRPWADLEIDRALAATRKCFPMAKRVDSPSGDRK